MLTRDAIRVLQNLLGIRLAEAVRVTVVMSAGEIDLVESETSSVAVAALVYQAQLRAARRIADPARQRAAIAAAREDAKRHDATIRARFTLDPHAAERAPRPQEKPVYPAPPLPSGTGAPHA